MKITGIFYKVFENIGNCYKRKYILWQLLFCLLTYFCVVSGFDLWYLNATQGKTLQMFLFPAVILGMLVPVFLPLGIIVVGYMRKNFSLVNTALALWQSALLGLGISSAYKVFTGRMGPHMMNFYNNSVVGDISHNFRFGIMRGGAFQGWPSSHTSVAFAVALTLVTMYPKNKWLKYGAIVYALYIGIGVSTNIHWFSDFVAGAILGSIIGIVVGKSFLERLKKNDITKN